MPRSRAGALLLLLAASVGAFGFAPAAAFAPSTRGATRPAIQRPVAASKLRARQQTIRAAADSDADPLERLFGCLPYILPILDGFSYGAYVYANVPLIGDAAVTAAPAVGAFQESPFSGFVLFIGLSFFTRNAALPRFVRFNIQQALLLVCRACLKLRSKRLTQLPCLAVTGHCPDHPWPVRPGGKHTAAPAHDPRKQHRLLLLGARGRVQLLLQRPGQDA